MATTSDKLYLIGFLLLAGLLVFLGRNLVQGSAVIPWALTFGGTTAGLVLVVSLYRVRLELKASRHELARTEAELNFAREVQRALFPRQLPTDGGLEFAAVCIPARGISGDYYDVMQLPDGRLAFAVADISGKGISAAIIMANLQALLRTLIPISQTPCEVLSRLNCHLYQVTDDSKFATFFYAEWLPAERRLRYVNAGHNLPILLGSCNGLRLDTGGMPLGIFPDTDFQTGEVRFQPGDMLVLYSDGITEATAESGAEFGEQRLRAIIEANRTKPVAAIQAQILAAVRDWAGEEQDDDMTLLIVRAASSVREQQ